MKSTLLQYPYGEVFEPLETICKKKGYSRIKIDQETGVLHATKGIQLFGKHIDLDFKVEKVDDQITRINITASDPKHAPDNKELAEIEERFIETISKFF